MSSSNSTSNLNTAGQRPVITVVQSSPSSRRSLAQSFGSVKGVLSGFHNPGGLPLAGDDRPLGNPNFPCMAGPEILPLDSATVPVDQGTLYLLDFKLPAASVNVQPQYVAASYELSSNRQQHAVSYDVYSRGNELPQDEVQLIHCPLYKVNTTLAGANTATVSGGTFLSALQSPGGDRVILDGSTANPYVGLFFDCSEVYNQTPFARILRIGIRYLSWKQETSQPSLGEGLDVSFFDLANTNTPSQQKLYGSWATQGYQSDAQYETRWLGETNFCVINKNNAWDKHPFTVDDLDRMKAGVEVTGILIVGRPDWGVSPPDTITNLDFIELVVEIIPQDRRLAAAIRILSNVTGTTYAPTYTKENRLAYAPTGYTNVIFTSVAPKNNYTMGIREALPADPSDRYRVAPPSQGFLYTDMEALGPAPQLLAVTVERPTLQNQISTRLAPVNDGVIAGTPVSFDQYNLGATIRDQQYLTNGAWWPGYQQENYIAQGSTSSDTTLVQQRIFVDGATEFSYIKILAKPDPLTTADLRIQVQQPYGANIIPIVYVSAAAIRALPDVGNGYREFAVQVAPFIPTRGYLWVVLDNPGGSGIAPWRIAGALSVGDQCWSGYDPQCDPQPLSYAQDLAITLMCTPPPIAAPTVTVVSTAISQASDASCGQASLQTAHLTWTSDAQYSQYGIYRSSGGSFTLVGVVENPFTVPTALAFDDLGAPWDTPVTYQLRGWRPPSNQVVVGTSAAPVSLQSFGAVIGLSSEGPGAVVMVYLPTDPSQVSLTWTDLMSNEIVTLSNENFQRALQAPEDRGLSVKIEVLIAHLASCSIALGTASSVGAISLAPTPFDTIRNLSRKPWVNVRLPGGTWRQMILQLGPLSVRTAAGVYMAEIILTDARAPRVFAGGEQ